MPTRIEKQLPNVVVLPRTTEEVSAVVKLCAQHQLPIIPRGAGTSLSGTVLAVTGGVMIALTRMTKILEIDYRNRRALVEAGCVNASVTQAVKGRRIILRARPFQPVRLHHRRQRRHQFRRPAHA